MKSILLVPYCPLPVDSGAKVEIWKHLEVLKSLGTCGIVSARKRPVGTGWKPEHLSEIRSQGYDLHFREDFTGFSAKQYFGYTYGLVCKWLRLERAFGHSNPYHRFAFPEKWWWNLTRKADLAVIHYSFWAHLPSDCEKVVVLHDLISNVSWEGHRRETRELKMASLVVVISKEEETLLNERGVSRTLWSPPSIPASCYPLNAKIGLIGSANRFNIEGLKWLEKGRDVSDLQICVYGGLAEHAQSGTFRPMGAYAEQHQPYKECGIILISTIGGTGVQIKAIEALAAGRAIIARTGSMRGIPSSDIGWIEVSTPNEMLEWTRRLIADEKVRVYWSSRATNYYDTYLHSDRINSELDKTYSRLSV